MEDDHFSEMRAILERMDANTNARLDEIHELVNSRLSEALKKIDRLEERLYQLTGEEPTGEPPRV